MRIDALTFKNENKDTITIVVDITLGNGYNSYRCSIEDIKIKPFRAKNDKYYFDIIKDEWAYRKLGADGRSKYKYNKFLEVVTKEQMQQALISAWESLKPNIENIDVK